MSLKNLAPAPRREAAALGAMLGALCGDACGSTVEFLAQPTDVQVQAALVMSGGGPFRCAPGQVTDDGELTLSLAWVLAEHTSFDLERVAQKYHEWVKSKPFDIGQTTRQSLGAPIPNGESACNVMRVAARQHCKDSLSNGALMRCVPLAIWGFRLPPTDLAAIVRQEASLSHPSLVAQDASVCYCLAISHLIQKPGDTDGAFQRAFSWVETNGEREVRDWMRLAKERTRVPFGPQHGFLKIGFCHAFRLLLDRTDYLSAVLEILEGGGDTDTNACIVGGMIGALNGADAMPKHMRDAVLQCDLTKGGQKERPDWLHPKHAPLLVTKLLQRAPDKP